MKIALITDTHYNFRKANKSFHEYFEKFYSQIFFPKLIEENITTVIHLGDAFDNRKGIDYWALKWAKENVYNKFSDLGIKVYNIVGNHDAYYKNTNEVNAIEELLEQYTNVVKISSPKEFKVAGMDFAFLPWICSDNEKEVTNFLENTKAKILFGHLELSGFFAYPGHVHTEGMSKDIFNKFDLVFSGHYHTRSDDGKIFYLGNPYQMFWSDVDDKRGFHIFDTDTNDLKFFENPFTMFEKIYYDEDKIQKIDESFLKDKMIKVIIKNREDHLKFEKFLDKIAKSGPLDLKVIETIDVYDDNVDCEGIESEDTLSILDKYIEESDFELNKNMVKKLLRELYTEALEVE